MKRYLNIAIVIMLVVVMLVPFDAFSASNVGYISGVTSEMCSADYWAEKSETSDEVIMTPDEIERYNQAAIDAPGTNCFDIEAFDTEYDGEAYAGRLIDSVEADYKTRDLYIGTEKLDNRAYFDGIEQAISETSWKNDESGTMQLKYGVCTKQADVMAIPSNDVILYSLTDPDSEYQLGALKVNDAVIIKQKCDYEGETFYYVIYNHLYGWVNAENIAICADRDEWLDSWKVDIDGDDFIVVTQDKIVTEPSIKVPSTNEVKLTIGAVLKLVPEDEIPAQIGERNRINNYVVYLPTRDGDGNYVKQAALISQHYDISVGFLPMTERNIMKAAFSCLGNRYGWAGMLDSMDCSLYARDVYRCFGMNMPRNTTWQLNVPNTYIDMRGYTDAEKEAIIENLPIGSLLYFPLTAGHVMLYTGTVDSTSYVISDTGSLSDPEGELNVMSAYSVIINPLTARRRNGNTWLSSIDAVVIPANFESEKFSPTKGWMNIDGKRCYVDDEGNYLKGLNTIDGKNYIFSKSTGELLYGKVRCYGKWYIMSKATGEMLYGKVRCDGKYYIMNKSNGTMCYGMVSCGGKKYICSKSDGHVFINQRVSCDGKIYYTDKNGVVK